MKITIIGLLAISHYSLMTSAVLDKEIVYSKVSTVESFILPLDTQERLMSDYVELGINLKFSFKATPLFLVEVKNEPNPNVVTHDAVFPKGTVLSIESRDIRAGLRVVYYQLDGAQEQLFFDGLRLVAKGQHIIQIRAIDYMGNEFVSGAIKFRIVE